MGRRAHRRRIPGAVRGGIARDSRSVLFGGARRPPLLGLPVLVALIVLLAAALVGGVLLVRMW